MDKNIFGLLAFGIISIMFIFFLARRYLVSRNDISTFPQDIAARYNKEDLKSNG